MTDKEFDLIYKRMICIAIKDNYELWKYNFGYSNNKPLKEQMDLKINRMEEVIQEFDKTIDRLKGLNNE